jgi:ribosomal protein S18 acetylase RimI-like enzyme
MTAHDLSKRVEEASLNAWPALRQLVFDGWLLRFGDGHTRRANAVSALHAGLRDPREKIAVCEALYRAQGLPTLFRLTGMSEPGLAPVLDALGYRSEGETRVLFADLARHRPAAPSRIELSSTPTEPWLAALAECHQYSEKQRLAARRILDALALPAIFAAARVEGTIASVAFAALHDGIASVNLVVTHPEHRRKGLSRQVISAILAWAQENGASGACLGVEATNAPAIALYEALGFRTELYRYHYRRKGE